MIWRDAIRLAVSALRGNIVRTLLTILGLSVGVGAVITVLSLGAAGEERVEEEIAKLGVNKVWIRPKDERRALSMADACLIQEKTLVAACAGVYAADCIQQGSKLLSVQLAGFDCQMQAVHALKLLKGRLFTGTEHAQAECVCVVDEALADQLGENVVGQRIMIGNRRPRIIGVVKKMAVQTMSGGSGLVILPMSTFFETIGGEVMEITLSVPQGKQTEEIAKAALASLGNADDFRADTLTNEINAAREVVRIFVMVLLCVALVCMLTGGIGVMNVLLVSVRERTREIGLLKAVGGTSAQVCCLFLLEAAMYALLGGLLGVGLGVIMTRIFGVWVGITARVDLLTALPVIAAAALLGAVFGAGPALRAAGVEPVEALQNG